MNIVLKKLHVIQCSILNKRHSLVMCDSSIGIRIDQFKTCYTNSIKIESIPNEYLCCVM